MSKLKCLTVGKGFDKFYTAGKVYISDADFCVCDDDSEHEDDFRWDLEVDGVTVRTHCCNDGSAIVATFEVVEE